MTLPLPVTDQHIKSPLLQNIRINRQVRLQHSISARASSGNLLPSHRRMTEQQNTQDKQAKKTSIFKTFKHDLDIEL